MKQSIILISIVIIVFFQSCTAPCIPKIEGTVRDFQSNVAIDSAVITVYENGIMVQEIYSNALGDFETLLEDDPISIFGKCERPFEARINKAGYNEEIYTGTATDINVAIKLTQ